MTIEADQATGIFMSSIVGRVDEMLNGPHSDEGTFGVMLVVFDASRNGTSGSLAANCNVEITLQQLKALVERFEALASGAAQPRH